MIIIKKKIIRKLQIQSTKKNKKLKHNIIKKEAWIEKLLIGLYF